MLVRKIVLRLENCEVITIDGNYVGTFCADDVRRTISRQGCTQVEVREVCNVFFMEIHKDANKRREMDDSNIIGEDSTVFERLQRYDDITSIQIHLFNQDEPTKDVIYDYFVPWNGDNDHNKWQHSKIAKTGWLYMVIGKDVDLETVFASEFVDDKQEAEFRARMLAIGDKNAKDIIGRHAKSKRDEKE